MENTQAIKKTVLYSFLTFIFLSSCVNKKYVVSTNSTTSQISNVSEIKFIGSVLPNQILKTSTDFQKKFKTPPKVIVIECYKDSLSPLISFEAKAFLYWNEEEKNFLKEIFFGVAHYKKMLIVFKGNSINYHLFRKLFKINAKHAAFNVDYGLQLDFAYESFRMQEQQLVPYEKYYSFDLR